METPDKLESDWIHSVFEVLREEVVAIADDFGDRVKDRLDQVVVAQTTRPPSTLALLTSVALESAKVASDLLSDEEPPDSDGDSEK